MIFCLVSEDYVSDLIGNMPTKGCSLDPLPTDLVKEYADDLVPLVSSIINESLNLALFHPNLSKLVPILVSFGVKGNVLAWFTSYVSGRFQSVTVAGNVSNPRPFLYGVPEGSVLGPVLFTLYSQFLLWCYP